MVKTIPYWPQMNGLVERQNQGILKALRIAKVTKSDWRKALEEYVYMYNTTPHSVTGKAPLELLTGRPVKDLLPSLRTDPNWRRDEQVRDNDAIRKMQGKLYADERRHARESEITTGDTVMLKNYESGKLEPNFKMEKFMVLARSGNDTLIANEDGVKYRRPVAHLKKWPSSPSNTFSDSSTDSRQPSEQQPTHSSTEGKQPRNMEDAVGLEQRRQSLKRLKKPDDDDDFKEHRGPTQKRPTRTKRTPKRYT